MSEGVKSYDIGTRVSVRVGDEGQTRLDGNLVEFYNGIGPIAIERTGRLVIVPADRIAWVEEARR